MILQIDAGNSRVHWRLLDAARSPLERGDLSWAQVAANGVEGLPLKKVVSVEFASVAGERARELETTLSRVAGAPVRDFRVSEAQCGVVNAYRDPGCMGIDRWLAMIGAFHIFGGPLTVLDAGTAITIDHVDARGLHRGGYILPGLGLMGESLGAGTAGVRADPVSGSATEPGTNTTECVHQGIAWLFETIVIRAARYWGEAGRLVVTGGDAQRLPAPLGMGMTREPDLIFLGMDAVVADEHSDH